MFSQYKVHFAKKDSFAKCHKQAFNLEKESKIINPHQMDLHTTMNTSYKGEHGHPAQSCKKPHSRQDGPIQLTSFYNQAYPNWLNGNNDVYIERKPQFPVY